ncbi:MAG TPA: ABC transporter [Firmicutes bacterium]|jgi:ABC-2 type transport system ATP-binding protein|nr:ABC transporter [Bacillota bacterium]HBL50728.1 ABC transporter [Bacillota bacterium]HBL68906.1 ABC transporter [Bacillota bacterium]HCF88956.1 ABC transporter [Bacillota bacterium]HCM17120.1 ABC transporter [Bacillota bacterium]
MDNILEIQNLTKAYDDFTLDKISLALPKGSIMGFIGGNGAGKTTTIKLILNLIHRDSGNIKVFGLDNLDYEKQIKEDLGVVFDESSFPASMKVPHINKVLGRIYKNWDAVVFSSYIDKFGLPVKKEIKDFSRGMKMKLAIAVALSHHAKLLILDEATSGLDPVVRDEILDVFLDFIQDENHSIFVSSHIISDIEKVADYIAFINNGRIIFCESKDQLLNNYGILKCRTAEFETLDRTYVKGYRKSEFGVEALVIRDHFRGKYTVDRASIEDIMLYTIKGESR